MGTPTGCLDKTGYQPNFLPLSKLQAVQLLYQQLPFFWGEGTPLHQEPRPGLQDLGIGAARHNLHIVVCCVAILHMYWTLHCL